MASLIINFKIKIGAFTVDNQGWLIKITYLYPEIITSGFGSINTKIILPVKTFQRHNEKRKGLS